MNGKTLFQVAHQGLSGEANSHLFHSVLQIPHPSDHGRPSLVPFLFFSFFSFFFFLAFLRFFAIWLLFSFLSLPFVLGGAELSSPSVSFVFSLCICALGFLVFCPGSALSIPPPPFSSSLPPLLVRSLTCVTTSQNSKRSQEKKKGPAIAGELTTAAEQL